ncbi:MAG: uroporphyrinogen-III synthase [Gammaproteobacteria bacterium]|nr:uroporphyrinogen-III synthase [Gammaproteobacteria bacterium]
MDGMPPPPPLTVVITRPADQAKALCQALLHTGAAPVLFPTITIEANRDLDLSATHRALSRAHFVIFISRNAVRFGLKLLPQLQQAHPQLQTVAVGEGSAAEFQQRCGKSIDLLPPPPYNSEGVLQLAQLQQLSGKKILILRGVGGRELLEDTLRRRGGEIHLVDLYRRALPAHPPSIAWQKVDIITTTSNAILENLFRLTPEESHPIILSTPLLVVSSRGEALARQLGFQNEVIVATGADTASLLEALRRWQPSLTQPARRA